MLFLAALLCLPALASAARGASPSPSSESHQPSSAFDHAFPLSELAHLTAEHAEEAEQRRLNFKLPNDDDSYVSNGQPGHTALTVPYGACASSGFGKCNVDSDCFDEIPQALLEYLAPPQDNIAFIPEAMICSHMAPSKRRQLFGGLPTDCSGSCWYLPDLPECYRNCKEFVFSLAGYDAGFYDMSTHEGFCELYLLAGSDSCIKQCQDDPEAQQMIIDGQEQGWDYRDYSVAYNSMCDFPSGTCGWDYFRADRENVLNELNDDGSPALMPEPALCSTVPYNGATEGDACYTYLHDNAAVTIESGLYLCENGDICPPEADWQPMLASLVSITRASQCDGCGGIRSYPLLSICDNSFQGTEDPNKCRDAAFEFWDALLFGSWFTEYEPIAMKTVSMLQEGQDFNELIDIVNKHGFKSLDEAKGFICSA